MNVDADTIAAWGALLTAGGALVRSLTSHQTIEAQLKECHELDLRVQGYMAGRRSTDRKRAPKRGRGK